MKPFKLHPDLRNNSGTIVRIAEELFGQAIEVSLDRNTISASWEIKQSSQRIRLSISHCLSADWIDFKVVHWGDGSTIEYSFFNDSDHRGQVFESSLLNDLWSAFVFKTCKPWQDWSEDEIMEKTVWCRYFLEDGGEPTDRMHNMMALKSYEFPEDLHVKEYFRIWQRKKQKQMTS